MLAKDDPFRPTWRRRAPANAQDEVGIQVVDQLQRTALASTRRFHDEFVQAGRGSDADRPWTNQHPVPSLVPLGNTQIRRPRSDLAPSSTASKALQIPEARLQIASEDESSSQ